MTYLIIDTSTDICLIALVKEGRIQAEHVFPHFNLLSKNLLVSIQQLMESSGALLSDLSFIAAGTGPGSYTGTRLGSAVAKSLAFGLGIEVKPFCSPLAFLPTQEGSFLFIIPTRAGPYFALKGKQNASSVTHESPIFISEADVKTESVDYFVSPLHELPLKPLFAASPNLPSLIKFLSTADTLPPEDVRLQYLHTPF